jgi:hypothetical protein
MEQAPDNVDRHEAVRQYSLAQILAVWAAAAVPMGVLAWVVAPWLEDQLGGDEPLTKALLLLLTAGLIWQFVLVLILTWRELGTLRWSRVREALWLRPPRDPRMGRVKGLVVGVALPGALRDRGGHTGNHGIRVEGTSPSSWAPTVARTSSGESGAGSRWSSCSPSSTRCSARSCSGGGFCCRACGASLEGATLSPMGCCSRSTTCTPRG